MDMERDREMGDMMFSDDRFGRGLEENGQSLFLPSIDKVGRT